MDSRDSSLLTTSSPDGPSCDDGGVLSVSAALAKDASLYFQSRKYAECVEVLNQLKQKKEDDPKVIHNIAIAEYFRDGCSDPKRLLNVLNNVKKRSEELACVAGEQVESVGPVGNKGILSSKGGGNLAHQFSVNSRSIIYMDEYDSSFATLNIAVIWFHLHEYAKALSVLEPLYQNIEPIDETTALHACLLLLDVVLACNDASKSADVLNYLERAFGVGSVSQGDNGSLVMQQSINLIAKSASIPCSSLVTDVSNSDFAVNASENPLSDDPLDEMFSILDIGGQNLSRIAGIASANEAPRTIVSRSISNVDLKLKLQFCKVRFLLLTRNLKQAKREVKHAINVGNGRDSAMALFLKAQLEYDRGNHRKAIKLLMASSNQTEAGIASMFNNNLGCIYYQLRKYHTSAVFFSKALNNCSSLQKDKPLHLLTFSQDKSLLMIYNCGLQYLACGKPILAACCFQKASLVFHKRPLFWLRLAECCLMALERGLIKASQALSDRAEVRVNVIGKGKWRQLVIEDVISNRLVDFVGKVDLVFGSDGQPNLSLPLARQCLYNAWHLLNCSELNNLKSGLPASLEENESSEVVSWKTSNQKNLPSIDSKASTLLVGLGQVNSNGNAREQKGGSNQGIIQNSISYYEEICRKGNQMIKQALLADLAYVELELGNPLKALSAATSLLGIPDCSRIYVFLGHVYAAEALCSLNKPKEAAVHLSIYLSGDSNAELPFGQEDFEQWRVENTVDCEELNEESVTAKNPPEDWHNLMFLKPEEARGTLYANLAAMSAMLGEFERAYHFVTQALSLVPNSPEATVTAIYVDLMLGKSQEALAKLKQCSRIRFLPCSLQLNKSS
ncbi:hypothetical protein SLEP1_g13344 [Rubroshorea leprosula]|uniref:CCR4-NOT transcription complex subunit 10 n=2 Tax=Rubroshorea leprosula TaxID=152421 RepID=A0AAV5IQ76_9ROSI|nr:hypothetical protein SLEP1_g13344 [Rubroshorea leprosula]